jgi:hypothetical protein
MPTHPEANRLDLEFYRKAAKTLIRKARSGHATPAGWFSHGLQNSLERDGNYAEVARPLLAAGAKFAPVDIPTRDEGVNEVFRENGLME